MGLSLTAHGTQELVAKLRDQAKRAKSPTPPLRVVAVELETIVQDSFSNGSSPAGEPWAPLKPSTIYRRAMSRGGGRRKARASKRKLKLKAYQVGVDFRFNKKALRNLSGLKILQDTARGKNATSVKASGSRITLRNNVVYMGAHLGGDTKRSPQRPPRRQWAPFLWVGGRWVFDDRGRGGQWMIAARGRVAKYIVRGEA